MAEASLGERIQSLVPTFHGSHERVCLIQWKVLSDLVASRIQHAGEVQEARRRRHVGDVRHPDPVRAGRLEAPVYQVRGGPGIVVTSGGGGAAIPVAGTYEASTAHQPRDPLATVSLAILLQIGMHAGRAIGLARAGVHST